MRTIFESSIVVQTQVGAEPEVGETSTTEDDRVGMELVIFDDLAGDAEVARARGVVLKEAHHPIASGWAEGLFHLSLRWAGQIRP
jgi:hypothetical protein